MAGNAIAEENVLLLRTTADVVQNQRHTRCRPMIADDTDMREATAQIPGDDIARPIRRSRLAKRQRPALTREPGHQVGHTAVVDIAVRAIQPQFFG